jgi:LuxR family transcriptional regulator, maltose regulon positive regulatory protein
MLERLERNKLFVVALDDERRWYRYHHLFAEFLRARFRHESLERFSESHLRAAAWYEREGWASEAIEHALAAGEDVWAARLIEQDVHALVVRGEGVTLDRWLSALPAELVRSRPRLCLAMANAALIGGRVDEVELLLADAERAHATAGEPPVGGAASGMANVPGMILLVRAELARHHGDAERTFRFAQRAMAHAGEGDRFLHYFSRWNLAVAILMQGRVGEAEHALADLFRDPWAIEHNRYLAVRAGYTLSQAQRGQGRLGAALETSQEALELAVEASRPPLPAAGVAHVGLAEISYERNELDVALRHAAEGVALCRQLGYAQQQVTSLSVLAWVRQALGDRAGALEAIGEAERLLPNPGVASA